MTLKAKCLSAASLAAVAGIMFFFISYAPMMTDNYVFSLDLHQGYAKFYAGEPVTASPLTFQSAFRQAVQMYFTWCGRFVGNLAVYLLFMLPHTVYCILAALVFALYVILLQMCVFGRQWRQNLSPYWIFLVAALLWAGIPSFGEAFLWLSVGGQTAMLGQALVFLPFRFALDAPLKATGWRGTALSAIFFLMGIIAASLDYPTSAALPPTAVICLLWLYSRQEKSSRQISWPLLFLAAGLCIGAMTTIAAPGNACRLALSNDSVIHAYLAAAWGKRVTDWLINLPFSAFWHSVPLLFLICGCLTLARQYGRGWIRRLPDAIWLFLLPFLFTHGAYLFTAWPPLRAFATTAAQLVVCACISLAAARACAPQIRSRFYRMLCFCLIIFCMFSIPWEMLKFWRLNRIVAERESIIANSKDGTAMIPPILSEAGRYWALGDQPDLTSDPGFWVNRAMALYHGLDKIMLAPDERNFGEISLDDGKKIDIFYTKSRIFASVKNGKDENFPESLHFYYYGNPAVLDKAGLGLGQKIFAWLSEARPGDFRIRLVPLLLARTDVPIKYEGSAGSGHSSPLKMTDSGKIWLVRPGSSQYGFDLIPLVQENP